MQIDHTKVDLNAPAFGAGAQTLDSVAEETTTTVTPAVEETPVAVAPVEEPTAPVEEITPSDEESKVPYGRFKKFHDLAKQNEADAELWRQHQASLNNSSYPNPVSPAQTSSSIMPAYWIQLYGDSEASQAAWDIQSQQNSQLIEQVRREALETVQAAQSAAEAKEQENLNTIEENIELLSDYAGRPLNVKEQEAVLDIVDEYTPKDNFGNYLGATMPFEKAWDIYQLKQQAGKAPTVQARNNVAQLSGTQTQGATSITEQNANFDPMNWDAWKNRV